MDNQLEMRVYSPKELINKDKTYLKNYLDELGYNGNVDKKLKKELISIITDKTELYIEYKKFCESIVEDGDKILMKEQKNVYSSIISFFIGSVTKEVISKITCKHFIPEISDIILSKLYRIDYPTSDIKKGLLIGGAGTGKTYIISKVVCKLTELLKFYSDEENIPIIQVLAPTNKAIKVIKSKIYDNLQLSKILPVNIKFMTISKFLQQEIEYTKEGEVIYKTKIDIRRKNYKNIKYVIIDESSMVSRNNWRDLNKLVFSKLHDTKILLIGDECQLPPVKEKSSIVFNLRLPKFRLSEIYRTKSEQITKIYNIFRESVIGKKKIGKIEPGKDLEYITSFKDIIKDNFDIKSDKVIAYSNNNVDKYNDLVRNIVFENPKDKYVIGEKLIFGTSVHNSDLNNNFLVKKNYFYANDETIVRNVVIKTVEMKFAQINESYKKIFPDEKFEVYSLLLEFEDGSFNSVYSVVEKDIRKFNKYFSESYAKTKELLKKTKFVPSSSVSNVWNIFYTVKNTINCPIKYSYSLTVYKSQGSTFEKIFVDMEDIHDCVKDTDILNKTLYTAVTRASDKIYLYKPNKEDYGDKDLQRFPYLKRYSVLDHKKAHSTLKDGQPIRYTRNQYQNKNVRKLVSCKVVHILHGIIYVGNGDFTWKFELKDDIVIYV